MREHEELRLEVGGFAFRAVAQGPEDGPLVLLLHGFPQSSYAWRAQLPALAAAGFRAVAPDQRGYSPEARPPALEAYRMGALLRDLFGFADALGHERFHLVGHDWGGALAWAATARQPERVRTLTVLSRPHPDAFRRALAEAPDQAHRSRHHRAFLKPETEALLLEDGARRLRRGLVKGRVPADAVAAYVAVLGTQPALTAALNWYRAAQEGLSAGGTRALGPVAVPTLYIWGDQDVTVGPEAAHWTGEYLSGPYQFAVVPGADHFLTDEAPVRVNELLLQHLAAHRDA